MQELSKLFKQVYGNVPQKQGLRQRTSNSLKRLAYNLTSIAYRISYVTATAYQSIVVALRAFKANKNSSSFKLGQSTTLGGTEAYITNIDASGKLYGKYYYYSWGGAYDGWHNGTWEPNGNMLNKDGTVWEKYSLKSNK